MRKKGRGNTLKPKSGQSNNNAKLCDQKALEVYDALGAQWRIAKKYNITQATVSQIKTKKTWSHIHD
jgi:hypothetical protein